MTIPTLQAFAAKGDPYWRWRLMVALTQGPITILPVPHSPGDVGRRGWPWRPGNVVG